MFIGSRDYRTLNLYLITADTHGVTGVAIHATGCICGICDVCTTNMVFRIYKPIRLATYFTFCSSKTVCFATGVFGLLTCCLADITQIPVCLSIFLLNLFSIGVFCEFAVAFATDGTYLLHHAGGGSAGMVIIGGDNFTGFHNVFTAQAVGIAGITLVFTGLSLLVAQFRFTYVIVFVYVTVGLVTDRANRCCSTGCRCTLGVFTGGINGLALYDLRITTQTPDITGVACLAAGFSLGIPDFCTTHMIFCILCTVGLLTGFTHSLCCAGCGTTAMA